MKGLDEKNKQRLILITIFSISLLFMNWPISVNAKTLLDCEDNMPLNDCLQQDENINEDPVQIENRQTINNSSFSFISNFLKMIFALLLILGLIYVMVKILGRKNHTLQQSKVIENLGGIPLGQNKSIQLVRIGNQIMVIGVGENIELLFELTDEETIELIHENEQVQTMPNNFLQFLTDKFESSRKKANQSKEFEQLFTNELEKMKEKRAQIIEEQKNRDDQNE